MNQKDRKMNNCGTKWKRKNKIKMKNFWAVEN
jgi:hypothetical protein